MSEAPQTDDPRRPLTGGAVLSAASRVTVAASGAAATIAVARLLGPDGAGAYALAQTLILLLILTTTLGIEHGITYYVSKRRWDARAALRGSWVLAVASGLAGAALGVLARVLIPAAFGELSVATTALAAGALPFALWWLYFAYVVLATDNYEAYAIPPALQSVLAFGLVLVLAAVWGVTGAVAGFTLAHVLTAIAVTLAAPRVLAGAPRVTPSAQPRQVRRAISFGVRTYAANALQFVNYRLDLFILAALGTAADVGHYSVAVAVTTVMWLLPQALSELLFPRIASLGTLGESEAEEQRTFVETKSLRHTVLIVAVSIVVLAAALVLLVVPIYGPDFRPAIELGLILLPGVAAIAISGTFMASFIGRGHRSYALAITLIVTPLTVVLYVLLIPPLDAVGAALASTCSYLVTLLLAGLGYRHATGAHVLARLVPTRAEIADYRALLQRLSLRAVRLRRSART